MKLCTASNLLRAWNESPRVKKVILEEIPEALLFPMEVLEATLRPVIIWNCILLDKGKISQYSPRSY